MQEQVTKGVVFHILLVLKGLMCVNRKLLVETYLMCVIVF
jgi:hypothetical protein